MDTAYNASVLCLAFYFLFFFGVEKQILWLSNGSYVLFMRLTNLFFQQIFFKKNRSHDTLHTFKNYFAIIFSVFNFQKNKWYPNRYQVGSSRFYCHPQPDPITIGFIREKPDPTRKVRVSGRVLGRVCISFFFFQILWRWSEIVKGLKKHWNSHHFNELLMGKQLLNILLKLAI